VTAERTGDGAAPRRTIDTDPHPFLRVYSAGNFAEVAPERLSIVAWSLVGPPQERAMRALADRLWPGTTWCSGSHFAFVGYFACRPYHNLSGLCHMAEQVPRLTAAEFTASYFEDAPPPPTPAGLREPGRRRYGAVPRLVREVASLRSRATELQGAVVELEAAARDALAARGPLPLGEAFARARRVVDRAWELHMACTASLPALRALQSSLGERASAWWPELEPWANRPRELVWSSLADAAALDWELGPGEFLSSPFYEVVEDRAPWSDYAPLRPAAPPKAARRGTGPNPAEAFWRMPGQRGTRALRASARAVGDVMANRELTKSLVMRTLHVVRRLLPPVAAAQSLAADDWPYLTAGEIADVHRQRDIGARAAARRAECAAALALPMPERLDLSPNAIATPAAPGGGRGVSAGVAAGVVVDVTLEDAPAEQPRILVADALDAAVESLLGSVDGVLTARGSLLSHVATLVREAGIPAVVGHPLSRTLRPGDAVALDGTTGEVTRLDA